MYILALNNQHPDQQLVVKSELMSPDTQDSSAHQLSTKGTRSRQVTGITFDLCRLGKTGHDILNQLATKGCRCGQNGHRFGLGIQDCRFQRRHQTNNRKVFTIMLTQIIQAKCRSGITGHDCNFTAFTIQPFNRLAQLGHGFPDLYGAHKVREPCRHNRQSVHWANTGQFPKQPTTLPLQNQKFQIGASALALGMGSTRWINRLNSAHNVASCLFQMTLRQSLNLRCLNASLNHHFSSLKPSLQQHFHQARPSPPDVKKAAR